MKNKFLVFMFVFLAVFGVFSSVSASDWQPVNYSNPDLIKEAGLTIEEFNGLTQEDWLELLGNKEKVNFAFQALDSSGKDITNERNQNIDINISGLNGSEVVKFENIEKSIDQENYILNFDGIDDYIEMGNVLNMGTNDWTVEFEMKTSKIPNETEGEKSNWIISKSYYGSKTGRWSVGLTPEGNLNVLTELEEEFNHYGDIFIADGEWHTIQINWDRDGYLKGYVDGVLDKKINISQHKNFDMYLSEPLRIGAYTDKDSNDNNPMLFYGGLLKSVRIWNKVIQSDMSKNLVGNEEGLLAYYSIESNNPSTLFDKTGIYDGQIYGVGKSENN